MPRSIVFLAATVGCGGALAPAPVERSLLPARVLSPGCVGSPYAGIQAAIDDAVTGDTIEVCAGTYFENLTISGKDLTLVSTSGADLTTIDAGLAGRALSVTGGADVTVTGFTFRNGTTFSDGGNVQCEGADLDLLDSVLVDGDANRGGGLSMSTCGGVVDGNTFRGNHVTWSGGGLYVLGSVEVLGNTFDANDSDWIGGGAYIEASLAQISGNTVIGNTSLDDGAGIYVNVGAPLIDGNTFELNDSGDEGGGLRVKLSEATITGNVFTSNHADYRGGASKISHEEVVMIGNSFVGNSTWVTAGALLLFESASLLQGETYIGNTASDMGGAVAILEGWGGVDFEDCTFEDNSADEGGHLYIALVGQRVSLTRVDLVGGSADRGGAVYAIGSDLDLTNTLFQENDAVESGGALYLDGVTGEITNAVFAVNTSPDASALRVKNGVAGLDVTNTVFFRNSTGAAVALSEGIAPTLRYGDYFGNTSDVSGLANPVGVDGNLGVAPQFKRPSTGNFRLRLASPLRNAGDPAILDEDGTASDMGLFGGPDAT
jgi:hypothetical protein